MTVFKGFLLITKRNIHMMFLYIAIFLTIAISVQKMTGGNQSGFAQESLNIAVIDRDGGKLARGLADYLAQYHTLVDLPDDPSVIQDRMFYREVYYIVTIPEDFEDRCLYGEELLPVTKIPGSNSGFYVDQQINTFLNDVRVMAASGFSLADAIAEVIDNSKDTAQVTMLDKNGFGGEQPLHAVMFQFIPYILISILCYSLGSIMIAFHNPDVKRRMMCSAIPVRRQNHQLVLGYVLVGIIVWLICTLMPFLLYREDFVNDPNMPYYLVNSFLMTLVALSLAFLVSTLISRNELISAVVNVISLGMSFLCGVFVDLDILGKGVRTFAQFLPVYWYELANKLLADNQSLSLAQTVSLLTDYGMQLLFAAVILGVALVISQNRQTA
ncbi:ABC transporter permease [Sporofaciens sp. JLR.KK001]|uniref:ABC transporter permease n=1 Tax=Sporofaciens sp. JLR.KK001 TaxID=3112621 RepID=UPI002FF1A257